MLLVMQLHEPQHAERQAPAAAATQAARAALLCQSGKLSLLQVVLQSDSFCQSIQEQAPIVSYNDPSNVGTRGKQARDPAHLHANLFGGA